MPNDTKKIKLIYIMGHGHSGSTLLDLLLGAQPNVESIGELLRIDKEFEWNSRCTCGAKIRDCEFWQEVLKIFESFFHQDDSISSLREKSYYGLREILDKSNTKRYFSQFFLGKKSQPSHGDVNNHAIKFYNLYTSILEVSNKEIIVDSSKNHKNLFLLALSGLFDLRIIYIFRNGYELMNSYRTRSKNLYKEIINRYGYDNLEDWYRKRLNKKLNRDISIFDAAKYSASFYLSTRNRLKILSYLSTKEFIDNTNLILLDYQKFATHPLETLSNIATYCGIDYDADTLNIEHSKYFLKNMGHNIGGNILRGRGIKPIKYNYGWKSELNKKDELIFKLVGGTKSNKLFKNIPYGTYI